MPIGHRGVEVFHAVMRSSSVTEAARLLRTSQPTVSRELARFERDVGLVLFDRRRGRLFPSAHAHQLFEEVERSFAGLERIAQTAEALRLSGMGELRVACLPALAQSLLPAAVHRLRRSQPRAAISVVSLESPQLERLLSEQRVDLGLIERREPPEGTLLEDLLTADEVAVLPAGHRLLARRTLRAQDFAGEAFVSFSVTDPYRTLIDAAFAAASVERVLGIETSTAASVCAMVREGLGVALVNPLTAAHLAGPGLHLRPVAFSIPFHVALVRPTQRREHTLREPFAGALHKSASTLRATLSKLAARRA